MKVTEFRNILKERILVMDGAMATEIQSKKLTEEDFRGGLFINYAQDLKGNNDLLNLTQPEVIKKIHRSFLSKGSDFINTNTFNSSSISQKDYQIGEEPFPHPQWYTTIVPKSSTGVKTKMQLLRFHKS